MGGSRTKLKYTSRDIISNGGISPGVPTLYTGKVTDISDPYNAGRIKVFIKGVDDNNSNPKSKIGSEDTGVVMEAFPLLPKMLHVMPSLNESVFIFVLPSDGTLQRFWVGPIISQPQHLIQDLHMSTAQAALKKGTSQLTLAKGLTGQPNAVGVYPDEKYVSVQGRDNTDIIHKSSELLFRAGKFVKGNPLVYNDKTMGYIQIKDNMFLENEKKSGERGGPWSPGQNQQSFDTRKVGSALTFVGNEINLISHDGSPHFPNLLSTDEKTQEQQVRDIIEKAHPLVFGDKLIEILRIMIDFDTMHIHNINSPPVESQEINRKLLTAKGGIDAILSKNIRIN